MTNTVPFYDSLSALLVVIYRYGTASGGMKRTWAVDPAKDGLSIFFNKTNNLKSRCKSLCDAFHNEFTTSEPKNLPDGTTKLFPKVKYEPQDEHQLRAFWPETKTLTEALLKRPLSRTDSDNLNRYYQAAKREFEP